MENKSVLNTITELQKIIKFVSTNDGKYLACLSCAGEVYVYDVAKYVTNHKKNKPASTRDGVKTCKSKKNLCKKSIVRKEVSTFKR